MNKTPNYALNQWEASDKVQRVDFNADNAKIDAALAATPKIAVGSYSGDGEASQFIDVGFAPKAVLVVEQHGYIRQTAQLYGGLAVPGVPSKMDGNSKEFIALAISGTGFRVYTDYEDSYFKVSSNASGSRYNYIAIG